MNKNEIGLSVIHDEGIDKEQKIKHLVETGVDEAIAKQYCEARLNYRSHNDMALSLPSSLLSSNEMMPAIGKNIMEAKKIILDIEFDFPQIRNLYNELAETDRVELPDLDRETLIVIPPGKKFNYLKDFAIKEQEERGIKITYWWFRMRDNFDTESAVVRINISDNASPDDKKRIMATLRNTAMY